MASRLDEILGRERDSLRIQPTRKRVRALLGDRVVADTTAALLVWEPRRVVPVYAVPEADLRADVVPAAPAAAPPADLPAVLSVGRFAVHTTPGTPVAVRADGAGEVAGFRPADPDLDAYVVLDFDALRWLEEEEPIAGHPRDPFHRVDARRSTRHARVELGGELLAESTRPTLVFETNLPVRTYLPREDVRGGLLRASPTHTFCPYKGEASYFSVALGDGVAADLAWTYPDPVPDAEPLRDLVAFFDERVDVVLDGERRPRPRTEWS